MPEDSEFQDRQMPPCVDCREPWVFTAKEQAFFKEKGHTNVPKRCVPCRAAARRRRAAEADDQK